MAMELTYHFENNVLCIYSIPVFFGGGTRQGLQKFI